MKAFTDLEQSKKLAEFLPPESADMCHKCIGDESYDTIVRPYSEYHEKYRLLLISKDFNAIPCWSLSALLNVLPSATLDTSNDHYCRVKCHQKCTEWYDNPVNACYEMIIRLNELKIL